MKTEKRAYAVVVIAAGNVKYLHLDETMADALAPFDPGDQVEIRPRVNSETPEVAAAKIVEAWLASGESPSTDDLLPLIAEALDGRPRVAPGEEWKSPVNGWRLSPLLQQASYAADRDGSGPLAADLRAAAEHFGALAAAPEGQEVPPITDLMAALKEALAKKEAEKAAGQEVPSALPLPLMVVCDASREPHLRDPYSHRCQHPRDPALPLDGPAGIACPRCGAEPGQPCGGLPLAARQSNASHPERYAAAKATALPEEVVCDAGKDGDGLRRHLRSETCINPRPAYPPASKTVEQHTVVTCISHRGRHNLRADCTGPLYSDRPADAIAQTVEQNQLGEKGVKAPDGLVDYVEIVDPMGRVSYRRPADHPHVAECRKMIDEGRSAYTIRPTGERVKPWIVPAKPVSAAPVERKVQCVHGGLPPHDYNEWGDCAAPVDPARVEPEKLGEAETLRAENARLLSALVSAAHALNCAAAWIAEMVAAGGLREGRSGLHERGSASADAAGLGHGEAGGLDRVRSERRAVPAHAGAIRGDVRDGLKSNSAQQGAAPAQAPNDELLGDEPFGSDPLAAYEAQIETLQAALLEEQKAHALTKARLAVPTAEQIRALAPPSAPPVQQIEDTMLLLKAFESGRAKVCAPSCLVISGKHVGVEIATSGQVIVTDSLRAALTEATHG